MDMLSVTDLYKRFGEKEVLRGLSLSVPERSVFGFVGKNGAGKTTAMKAVLGLLRPDSGTVYVNGERVTWGQTPTNRHIGYLPDVPEFYPFMTAREYLIFCGELGGIPGRECALRADELLELVGLLGEGHRIKGYSRGMKQRLGIAQALMHRPRLLICDEPTSALDPAGRREILDILSGISERTTVLFSTHILSDVERICTDVAFLNEGKAELCGKLADIKAIYRKDEYELKVATRAEISAILAAFPRMREGELGLSFTVNDHDPSHVLRFLADKNIVPLSFSTAEPTLEALFMEVAKK
ncbi:MAG: ABC transporter ATP-binding protein [Clostridia bacterium]|nr:ABC transporter ATP-binding protein [Clostridia bacterium]